MTSNELVPHGGTSSCGSRCVWPIVLVVAGALVVRGVYLYEAQAVPSSRQLMGDAAGYYRWAQEIARGNWLGEESFYQAPLYPYVLGVCFKTVGANVWTVRVIQAVWGALAVGCLWFVGSRLFGRAVGLVAAVMLAAYAPAVFFDGIVQKASLACFLTCALLAVMAWYEGGARAYRALAVGVVVALLVVTRENALVWLAMIAVWFWTLKREGGQRVNWVALGSYAIGVSLVLLPVGLRNKVVGGEWSVSTFQAGTNFYIGNHLGADGRYRPLVRGHETPTFERRDATVLAEADLGRTLTAKEVSGYWLSRAMGDIKAETESWVGLMGRKSLMVWNRYEVSDAESQYVHESFSVLLRALGSVWHFGILCPLAAVGVMSTGGQWRRLWIFHALIVSMAAAVALFFVLARYRLPLVPLLIVFAAAGCVETWRGFGLRRYRALALWGVVALGVATIVNWPVHDEHRLNAMAWMNVGTALAKEGDLAGATGYFRRAVEGHRESAEANNNLAQALALQGDFGGSIGHYQAALAAVPGLLGVNYNLAVALEQVGRVGEAILHYRRATELDPSDADAHAAVARLRGRR